MRQSILFVSAALFSFALAVSGLARAEEAAKAPPPTAETQCPHMKKGGDGEGKQCPHMGKGEAGEVKQCPHMNKGEGGEGTQCPHMKGGDSPADCPCHGKGKTGSKAKSAKKEAVAKKEETR